MTAPIAIHARHLSKKFAKSLKSAMAYGLGDIARASILPNRGRLLADFVPADENDALRSNEFWALRDVDFTIRQGERVGIIGPNGAGKSTLFSVLSGIYGPTAGRVEITGRLQALIALGAGFHPMLSGRENVYINAAILGLNKKTVAERIERIIDFSGIGDFIDMPVKNYSSGMLVRLGFAVAANMDPDIMLIDEVLAVGDAQFQSKCVGFTQRLADEGKTVVMVSHQLPQVLRVCERVIWMEHGQVIADGPAERVVRNYSARSMQRSYAQDPGDRASGTVRTAGIEFHYAVVPSEHAESMEVGGGEAQGMPVVFSGHDLAVRIRYTLKQEVSGGLNWWLHVKDAISGLRVIGTSAKEHDGLLDAQREPEGEVEFVFPAVQLLDGVYNLDLGVTDFTRSGESHGIAAYCERQPSFFVVSDSAAFREPFRAAADDRLPVLRVPSHFHRIGKS